MSAAAPPTSPSRPRRRWSQRQWWVAFVVACVVALGYSVAVGHYLADRREPVLLGESGLGEWADLSDHGFRLRVDDITVTDELPSRYTEGETVRAPDGMAFFRAMLTIEVLVPPDGDMGCYLTLLNSDGEELDFEEYSVGDPDATECILFDDGRQALDVGDTFESQLVRVVLPDDPESFRIEVQPAYASEGVYWLFSF